MAAETNNENEAVKFELAGVEYEMPDILDLDMDEWMVVYDYSGLVLEDFAPLVTRDEHGVVTDGDEDAEADRVRRLRHPGFMKAMVHIAYQRAHPKQTASTVKAIIGNVKLLPFLESMTDEEAVAADNPTVTSEPEPSSKENSLDSNGSSSPASAPSSAAPANRQGTIGMSG